MKTSAHAKTLLLVDDEPQISAAIRRVLFAEDYEVLTANDAEQAMAILEERSVDVIVSDQRMPGRKGTEFLAAVKVAFPDTVRLILSGAADVNDVASAMETGVIYKFLTKPTDPALLRANIREAFHRAESIKERTERDLTSRIRVAGLPGRADLENAFEGMKPSAEQEGKTLCLLMVKIDQYPDIAGSFGQSITHRFLDAIGRRLLAAFGDDCHIGYDSGGNFLILASSTDPFERIASIDYRLDDIFAPVVEVDDLRISITVSVGATTTQAGTVFDELIDEAHAAMMTGSDRGGATIQIFQPYLVTAFRAKLEFESNLRQAFADGALQVYYQPQVEVASGRITGLEALMRWQRESGVYVSPGEFVPAAERLGLIHEFGVWVLETAIDQLQTWQNEDLAPRELAVNVSPLQLKDPSFVEKVAAILGRTGLSPERLVLEITESVAIEHEGTIGTCLEALKELGVTLAIDDFGSGYANLGSLTRLPFQKLKIDRSLLPKPGETRSSRLFSAVISMSHELGMATVAEGVETDSELDAVYDAGCGVVQGYRYARPESAEALTGVLKRGFACHRMAR